MLQYPHINPILVSIGPVHIHWYGMMYVISLLCAYGLGVYRLKKQPAATMTPQQFGDLIFYAALGLIVGGRLGSKLFYNTEAFIRAPWEIFYIWQPGMSFHGALIGVILAMWWYARRHEIHFWDVTDFLAPLVPIGLFFGRIGNFINGELWGRPTDLAIGMVFPHAGLLPRWPSQLIEAALEGVLLFVMLNVAQMKPRARGQISGLFLLGYGCLRFLVEFIREPDRNIGFIAFDWLTMGQVLSVPMIMAGLYFVLRKTGDKE